LINDFVINFALSGMNNIFPESIVTKYPSFFDMFQVKELEELISFAKEGSSPGSNLINYSVETVACEHHC